MTTNKKQQRVPYSLHSCAKTALSTSPFWHYVFCVFRELLSIFKNPCFCKIQARHPKTQNEDGRGQRNIFWPFWKTPILSFVWPFQDRRRKSPIFPRSSGHSLHSIKSHHSKPEGGSEDGRQKIGFSRASFSVWYPKTTPHICAHLLR